MPEETRDMAPGRVLPPVTSQPMVKGDPTAAAIQRRVDNLKESAGRSSRAVTQGTPPFQPPASPQTPSPDDPPEEIADYTRMAGGKATSELTIPDGKTTLGALSKLVGVPQSAHTQHPTEHVDEGSEWHPGEVTKRGPQIRYSGAGLAGAMLKKMAEGR